MKPSEKRAKYSKEGKTVLRVMVKRVHLRIKYFIMHYVENGWRKYGLLEPYSTEQEAYDKLEEILASNPVLFIDDRYII